MSRFAGKVVMVTGAGSGIGRATALAFAAEGAKLVIADTDAEGGMSAVGELERAGAEVLFTKTDVSKRGDVSRLAESALEVFGGLDCAVNNAGILERFTTFTEQTPEEFDRAMEVNLKGPWLCMKFQIPLMLEKGGSIVNVASVNGVRSAPFAPVYSASKFGVLGLTRSAAIEYGRAGVRINAICPGAFPTAMLSRSFPGARAIESLARRIPMGRVGRLDEVAAAILWLCSESASYVAGEALCVDGGWLAAGRD